MKKFITFEGGEGAGKTTMIASLYEALTETGQTVVRTREPGGCPGAEVIRGLLVTGQTDRWTPHAELLLHYAARTQHNHDTIKPALDGGHWVLSDRYFDSTMAYQGWGNGMSHDLITMLRAYCALRPVLTIILDIPVRQGLDRAQRRDGGASRYENMNVTYHQQVREGYHSIAALEPDRCVLLDAARNVDEVWQDVKATVEARFSIKL